MITIKCAYKNCKHGGEVDKNDAVKDKNRYWHKDCIEERDLKAEIVKKFYENFNSNSKPIETKTALSRFIHDIGYEAEYVMFCLLEKAKDLNSLYGLKFALNNKSNYREYKRIKARHTKLEKYEHKEDVNSVSVVKIDKKKRKGWGDYFE